MSTNEDIELHELQAIEQRLSGEAAHGRANPEGAAAPAVHAFALAAESGFEIA